MTSNESLIFEHWLFMLWYESWGQLALGDDFALTQVHESLGSLLYPA